MERNLRKKSVRFSSPFDNDYSLSNPQIQDSHNSFNIYSRKTSFNERNTTLPESDRSPGNLDSWDAFDVKMKKVKPKTSEEVGSQFLELSYSQGKTLSNEDQHFSSMSFKEAKSLLEKDENERLQFINSNTSFSGGIEEIEAPSLLSFTTYFQQGSSFPVPYAGNDSTMMFGEGLAGISSTDIKKLEAQRQTGGRQIRNPVKTKMSSGSDNNNKTLEDVHNASTDLSRKDSLATFFLGSQSNGMKKGDIMEYVIDYCKRKASYSLSDTLQPTNISVDEKSDKRDSGIDTVDRSNIYLSEKENIQKNTSQKYPPKGHVNETRRVKFATSTGVANIEQSVLLADGASIKQDETNFLDTSDIEGFEKFEKSLNSRTNTRYRTKAKHNLEFETKRLNEERHISHPTASPNASSRPGSSASLERPSKKLTCNSPPEKLHKTNSARPSPLSPLPQPSSINPLGQCHSTPLGNESLVSKYLNVRKDDGTLKAKAVLEDRLDKLVEENGGFLKKPKISQLNIIDSTIISSSSSGMHSHQEKDATEANKKSEISNEVITSRTMSPAPVSVIRPNSLSVDPSNINRPIQILPDGLSILPIIHSGPPQNHSIGSQSCSCPHQHSQHQQPSPVIPGVGMPIVIHIHLPCTMTHPVSTIENTK